jgi:hypothetical protein
MANVEPLDGAVPPPPATFMQPLTDAQGAKGQFLFLDVKDVRPDGPGMPSGAAYDRSGWTASSSPMPVKPPGPGAQGNENLDPGNALDGKIGTRWSIGDLHDSGPGAGPTAQKLGDQFTVDMKQPRSLSRLTFWAGGPERPQPSRCPRLPRRGGRDGVGRLCDVRSGGRAGRRATARLPGQTASHATSPSRSTSPPGPARAACD